MLRVWWLGRCHYRPTYELQQKLVAGVAGGDLPETLLLVEHEPVITLGRGADRANLGEESPDTPVVEVERGGDVTWHGPGQLVGYPILRLREEERDLHLHLRRIEDLLIATCRHLGNPADRNPGYTGVWTSVEGTPRKVASIGVAVRRWVTYHGFALNVGVSPDAFEAINPCGLDASLMTSLDFETDRPIGFAEVIETLVPEVATVFDREPVMERTPVPTLRALAGS